MAREQYSQYVRTGQSRISQLAAKASVIPVVGLFATPVLGTVGTLWDVGKQLVRGRVFSAATELTAGVISTGVNSVGGTVFWAANAMTAGASDFTIGTHARAATESAIGAVTGLIGMKPKVLSAHMAGIGAPPGSWAAQAGPGRWAQQFTPQGQDARQYYQNYRAGAGQDHVAALQAAAASPGYRGI
jgi:hypothetical protein